MLGKAYFEKEKYKVLVLVVLGLIGAFHKKAIWNYGLRSQERKKKGKIYIYIERLLNVENADQQAKINRNLQHYFRLVRLGTIIFNFHRLSSFYKLKNVASIGTSQFQAILTRKMI